MSSLSQFQWDILTKTIANLTDYELIEFFGDTMEDRELAFVAWDVRDFEAQIEQDFTDIPEPLRSVIAKTAYASARSDLSDIRAEDTIVQAISGAWHDYKLSQQAQTVRYKMRLRHPVTRSHVEQHYWSGKDGSEAHSLYVQMHPEYRDWGLVSLSEA